MTDECSQNADPLGEAWDVQQAAASMGFDWPDTEGVMAKLHEELGEIQSALDQGQMNEAREELGDLLFSAVNLARFLDIHPAQALRGATAKFSRRFKKVKEEFARQGRDMAVCSLQELDEVWDSVKREA